MVRTTRNMGSVRWASDMLIAMMSRAERQAHPGGRRAGAMLSYTARRRCPPAAATHTRGRSCLVHRRRRRRRRPNCQPHAARCMSHFSEQRRQHIKELFGRAGRRRTVRMQPGRLAAGDGHFQCFAASINRPNRHKLRPPDGTEEEMQQQMKMDGARDGARDGRWYFIDTPSPIPD